ncbi:MAG TPA: ABA4-like family protein [Novosphingobium sp.]|nr:ABA4-like family protein [Novosphingobium sp.]
MWAGLFGFVNLLAMAAWAVLAFLPRRPLAHSAVLYLGTGLLCLIYTVSMALLIGGAVAPGGQPDAGGLDLTSIEGVRRFFLSDAGLVIGWTHYLAFDLFTGLWIARDADAKGFSRIAQLPFLALTFLAGPVGLLLWLVVRERRARAAGRG